MINTINAIAPQNSGFLPHDIFLNFVVSVKPYTRPLSSPSDFGFVNKLIPTVAITVISHAQHALQKLAAIKLASGLKATLETDINSNFTKRNIVIELIIPRSNPQKAAGGVVLFQNIPNKIVANNGAFTIEKIACI